MSEEIRKPRTETEIAERAFEIADRLGLKLKAVKVQDAGPIHGALGVAYLAGLVRVSRRAAHELTDSELDFALAFAMAITPGIMMGYMFIVSVICFSVIVFVGSKLGWPLWISLFLAFVATSVMVTITSRLNLQNEQRKRLKKALNFQPDFDSAKSYIEKLNAAQAQIIKGYLPESLREDLLKSLEASKPDVSG